MLFLYCILKFSVGYVRHFATMDWGGETLLSQYEQHEQFPYHTVPKQLTANFRPR